MASSISQDSPLPAQGSGAFLPADFLSSLGVSLTETCCVHGGPWAMRTPQQFLSVSSHMSTPSPLGCSQLADRRGHLQLESKTPCVPKLSAVGTAERFCKSLRKTQQESMGIQGSPVWLAVGRGLVGPGRTGVWRDGVAASPV